MLEGEIWADGPIVLLARVTDVYSMSVHRGYASAVGILLAVCLATLSVAILASRKSTPHPSAEAAAPSKSKIPAPSPSPMATIVGPEVRPSRPVTIDIPAIDVHSPMLSLGLNPGGSVNLPSDASFGRPGWFRDSAAPGTVGSAVILGHVGSEPGAASVFSNLSDVRRGNKIILTLENGVVAVFQVTRVKSYPKNHFPTALVYDNENSAALKLIATDDASSFFSRDQFAGSLIVSAFLVASHRG